MKKFKTAVVISSLLFSTSTFAQDANRLNEIVVTANPLGRSASQISQPVNVVAGDELVYKMQPTIGETLSKEPGIRSTYFGPGASRPVIRGLQDDQILVLQNGLGNIDASAASVDHNVSIDPLTVERVEVVRGPAALLYGSRAVGGVVNVIDNRIPDQPIDELVTGVTDARFNSANNERAGSILLEGGIENYAWHINGFKRITDDIDIPGFARSEVLRASNPGANETKDSLTNSNSNSDGGSFGLTRFLDNDKGYIGASVTRNENRYGTVAEEDVTVDMDQTRFDVAGLYKKPSQSIKEVRFKAGVSEYQHTEFEGDETGTIFENDGYDGRVEIVHEKIAGLEGAIGFQSSRSEFSALGEEAFIPKTDTKTNAIFLLEELPVDKFTFQFGARAEKQEIDKEGSSVVRLGTNDDSREDDTFSGSAGFVYKPGNDYAVALSTSYTQRAPNAQEFFANGVHVATGVFERGDRDIKIQKSTGVDLSFRKEKGSVTGEVNLFYNQFQDFITLVNTGGFTAEDGENFPNFSFVNLPAKFYGLEAKSLFNIFKAGSTKFDIEVRGDYVEAKNRRTGEHLSRISPARVGTSLIYKQNKLGLRLDADQTFAQTNIAQGETKTKSYLMLDFGVDYQVNVGNTNSLLYVKGTNLLDEEARNHVSFIKDVAPLMGRSFVVGIRTAF